MQTTPLLYALLSLIPAAFYVIVGRSTQSRPVTDRNRLAITLFGVWWYALAASTVLSSLIAVLAVQGITDVGLHVALTMFNLFLICIALWGLLYYFVFLFTGKSGVLGPLTVGYVAYFFALVYYVFSGQPNGIEIKGAVAQLHYAHPPASPFFLLILSLLLMPQILGSLAFFFGLIFIVKEREQRFRITVVSWSIIVWFGVAFVSALLPFGGTVAWQFTSRAIGLLAATAILIAYVPPPGLRRWFAKKQVQVRSAGIEVQDLRPRVASTESRQAGRSNPAGTVS